MVAETNYKNRKVVLLKAEGPKGSLGELDDALIKMLDGEHSDTKAIIMIDAALKLEGEKTGDVAEGVGAAIGGYGVEKFKIEEAAYRKGDPALRRDSQGVHHRSHRRHEEGDIGVRWRGPQIHLQDSRADSPRERQGRHHRGREYAGRRPVER